MLRISLEQALREMFGLKPFLTVVVVVSVTSILLVSLMSGRSNKIIAISEETSSPAPLYFKSWEGGAVTALKPQIAKNCRKIIEGDLEEARRVQRESAKWKNPTSDQDLHRFTANCSWVRESFEGNLYTTRLEQSFPIAITFTIYNSPQQVVRLLKVLYRRTNQYCIHIDSESSRVFKGIFSNIAKCLDNVHMATTSYRIRWGDSGVMKAQMQCLRDLVELRYKLPQEKKWNYAINLCGKELPINTNHEIVSHLVKLNDSSAINAFEVKKSANDWKRLKNKKIPFHLPFYKSQSNIAVSFPFAEFLFKNATARKLYKFFLKCNKPEEHFYAAAFRISGAPGGFNPNLPKKLYIKVEKCFWMFGSAKCSGRVVHNVCIVTTSDLNAVLRNSKFGQSGMFHNKYFMEDDHAIMDCVEEMTVEKNRREYYKDHGEV